MPRVGARIGADGAPERLLTEFSAKQMQYLGALPLLIVIVLGPFNRVRLSARRTLSGKTFVALALSLLLGWLVATTLSEPLNSRLRRS